MTDAAGNIYVIGGTIGDGPDVMTLKFDSAGVLQWREVWDGTAFPPFDQDSPVKILLDPTGNVLSCITGYMGGGHPDYVVVKYAPTNGATLWEGTFGVSGVFFLLSAKLVLRPRLALPGARMVESAIRFARG